MTRVIGAVIFDLDGLLVDSEPLQIHAWQEYLKQFDAELTPELLGQMYGLRLSDSSEVVARVLKLPVTAVDIARGRDALFLELVPGNIEPCPGAREIVRELHRRGVPLGLATSGHRRYVDLALESAAIPRLFDVEITGELVQLGKPNPETFLLAAKGLGVEPDRCLVLEDSPNGVRAAKLAGMACLAIPNDDTGGYDLSMADAVISSLADILDELRCQGWELDSSAG